MRNWSTPATVRQQLRKKWDTGAFLTERARGGFVAIDVPLRGPTVSELGSRYADVQGWVREWFTEDGTYTLSTKVVGTRGIGANAIPARMRIQTFEDLTCFLGTGAQARRHRQLIDLAGQSAPEIRSWVVEKPIRALTHEGHFGKLLACVRWLVENANTNRYLRQIDVVGVDTKFVENHRAILTELLDLVGHGPVASGAPDFASRYGFRTKPTRVRIRLLGTELSSFWPDVTDVELLTDELARLRLDVDRAFLVENEVTCLAFPPVRRSVVIFGGGYAVSRAGRVGWLEDVPLYYWGDIDTHGFRILNLLRARFPPVRSMLMDRSTLFAHEEHWDREPSQVNVDLPNLTADEAALYRDLVEDTFGSAVRLEQERVTFSHVEFYVESLLR